MLRTWTAGTAALLLALVAPELAVARPAHWATPSPLAKCNPVPAGKGVACNLYKVTPTLYRSEQPDAAVFGQMASQLGIKTELNLRLEHPSDAALLKGTGIKEIDVPMIGFWPNQGKIVSALKALRAAEKSGPVLVHCQFGADRTGAVIAMYRVVYQGWTQKAAADEMEQGDYHVHTEYGFSKFVRNVDIAAFRAALAKAP